MHFSNKTGSFAFIKKLAQDLSGVQVNTKHKRHDPTFSVQTMIIHCYGFFLIINHIITLNKFISVGQMVR